MMKKIIYFVFLSVSLLYFYGAVGRINLDNTHLYEYKPYPDASEYLAMTKSILNGDGLKFRIGNDWVPSRYPPGASLCYSILGFVTHFKVEELPFKTNYLIGNLILLTLSSYLYIRVGLVSACTFPVLLVTFPGFVLYSRSPMSEMTSVFVILIVLIMLTEYWVKDNLIYYILACVFMGLSLLFRTQNLFFALFLAIPLFKIDKCSWKKQIRVLCFGFVAFSFATIPLLYYNFHSYGSVAGTGYSYWLSKNLLTRMFSFDHIFSHLGMYYEQVLHPWKGVDSSPFYGSTTYFSAFFILLIPCSMIVLASHSKLARRFLVLGLLALVPILMYRFIRLRFHFTHMIFGILMISVAYNYVCSKLLKRKSWKSISVGCIFVVLMMGNLLGIVPTGNAGFQSLSASFLKFDRLGRSSELYKVVEYLNANDRSVTNSVLVLTNYGILTLYSMLDDAFLVIPASENHVYRHSERYRFESVDIEAYLENFKQNRMIVYLLDFQKRGNSLGLDDCLNKYIWRPVYSSDGVCVYIMR